MPATSVLISNQEMQQHQLEGTARPLSPGIPDFISWYEAWWTATPDGWLRVADTNITRTLNRVRRRFDTLRERGVAPYADPTWAGQ